MAEARTQTKSVLAWISRSRAARGNGLPNGGLRSFIVDDDVAIFKSEAQLVPEPRQIHRRRLITHLAIKFLQDASASRPVADNESFLNLPVLGNAATLVHNCAQGILQAFSVAGAFANLHVSHETEKCSTPVGSSPGV